MKLDQAKEIANKYLELLKPHCERIEIAGSIRREKPEVKDIEIVSIPKPYDIGLFESGIATVVNKWPKVRGELPCKYTQRELPEGINLDLFFAQPRNWGWIYALRTGSSEFNQRVWLRKISEKGYKAEDGHIWANHRAIWIREEINLFEILGLEYLHPRDR